MASNPLLSLQVQTPDIGKAFSNALLNVQRLSQIQGAAQDRDISNQTRELASQVLDENLDQAQRDEAQAALTALNPQVSQQLQAQINKQRLNITQEAQDNLRSVSQGALIIQGKSTDVLKLAALKRRRAEIVERGGETADTDEVINLFETGQADLANQQIDNAVRVGQQFGFIKRDDFSREELELKREDLAIKRAILKAKVKPEDTATKEKIKINVKRMQLLSEGKAQRKNSITKAKSFLKKFEEGKASSGAGRTALSFLPGTFSKQGRFDELLDAFAEVAAREKLKAVGEIRPTDADVKGMKQSLFGPGRAEENNIILLREFISSQETVEQEFKDLRKSSSSGTLGEITPSSDVAPLQGIQEGATATNPQTGQKVIFTNGQWQPAP